MCIFCQHQAGQFKSEDIARMHSVSESDIDYCRPEHCLALIDYVRGQLWSFRDQNVPHVDGEESTTALDVARKLHNAQVIRLINR